MKLEQCDLNAKFVADMMSLLYAQDFYHVTPEEVRDALSYGQLISKLWLQKELQDVLVGERRDDAYSGKILIVGGWIGTLSNVLFEKMPTYLTSYIVSADLNSDCQLPAERINEAFDDRFRAWTTDMYDINYMEFADYLIVNTSCEHIRDVREWLDLMPADTLVCLQSNNMFGVEGHINCCESLDEFKDKCSLSFIDFSGEIVTNEHADHRRFMLIGRT